ncbi:MAG: ATP-dependent DNA ligase [Desulfobacteraceae bacterium]|nr:MAG: ATP-dependent DNA ligase [Desulfobacteraceae bacterium]
MKIEEVVEASERLRATAGKKAKVSILADLLRRSRGKETYLLAHYLVGSIPSGKIGIGWRTIQNAMEGLSSSGGSVEIHEVQKYLEDLSRVKGSGSAQRKTGTLRELFGRLRQDERSFLTGLLLGELRQGALEGLVLEALAIASSLPPDLIRQSFMFSGDIGLVAEAALHRGKEGLGQFGPRLFRPVYPMLASPAQDPEEALGRLGEAAWEYKIDGARIQVHKGNGNIRVFTRQLKDVTESLPEITDLARTLTADEAIFEGEAFALQADGKPLPFQTTMRRFGRIRDVEKTREEIPLSSYFFDLLYLDGEPLFTRGYRERFRLLSSIMPPGHVIPSIVTADPEEASGFLRKSLDAGHEGLMAKGLDSTYAAGQRGFHWLKVKRAQTLDLVILAAEWGHGRRQGWLSNIHLGARDPESGRFVMLGKTFKGLTDQMLRWMTEKLRTLETDRDSYTVYVKPELVVEIAYSDIQESPRYPGGLALRFARVKRFREDKKAGEADTIQTVWSAFQASSGKQQEAGM